MSYVRLTAIVALLSVTAVAEPNHARPGDFAFVQFTDIHISPKLARMDAPAARRPGDCVEWLVRAAVGPQELEPFGLTAPAPSFALATGDLTEYGVIDDTWSVFEQTFADLPYPIYVQPGNHDNTWVAMYDVMRARHGGENYSFEHAGCHIACICSASPQEPVPTIDAKARAWLRADLSRVAPGTPVFLALHHPLYSGEFANPAEADTLVDLLRDHNVALILCGHGHQIEHRRIDGVDSFMGGSTFGTRSGYAVISVQEDVLRVAYRYSRDPNGGEEPAWRRVFEKPLARAAPQRLFRIVAPEPDAVVRSDALDVRLSRADLQNVTIHVDGKQQAFESLGSDDGAVYRIKVDDLAPGRHLLSIRANAPDADGDLRTVAVQVERGPTPLLWRHAHPAAIKAGPVVGDGVLFIARTDGVVAALVLQTGAPQWTFKTGGEILGTPAWDGRRLIFGSGDGGVYALSAAGEQLWKFDAGRPVYGAPLIDDGVAYVGDVGGRLHAINLQDGARRWTFERADYCIESRPCVWGERVVFGAWDGFLYAVERNTGELAWKTPGPKSSEGRAARYYAPADCGPVALADALWVCDRGYVLGIFNRAGDATDRLAEGVTAIAPAPTPDRLICRYIDDQVSCYDAAGQLVWRRPTPAGRFPIPPTARDDVVAVCSNRGRLSLLDARTGAIRHAYQVTEGFYVMAPVAMDARGVCYVAGMDGAVSAIRFPSAGVASRR